MHQSSSRAQPKRKRVRHGRRRTWLAALSLAAYGWTTTADIITAEPAVLEAMVIYDEGFAYLHGTRHLTLIAGENTIRFDDMPTGFEPGTLWATTLNGRDDWTILEQVWHGDKANESPHLIWRVQAESAGDRTLEWRYRAGPVRWSLTYEWLLDETQTEAEMYARVELDNQAGGHFAPETIQLVTTERGLFQQQRRAAQERPHPQVRSVPLRYGYGDAAPAFEKHVRGLQPVHTYTLPTAISLNNGARVFVQFAQATGVPVELFYVYHGVRFDHFQRARRTDWQYGTETHPVVDAHLQFKNESAVRLGIELPVGRLRVSQRRRDGSVEFIGEDTLLPTAPDATGQVRLGPARGLQGRRERTHYTEIRPGHEYEESFAITVENLRDETVEIRVVEQLYRWPEFEIARADAEYTLTGDQTIEFRPTLRPGGRRTIHYTVRYTW